MISGAQYTHIQAFEFLAEHELRLWFDRYFLSCQVFQSPYGGRGLRRIQNYILTSACCFNPLTGRGLRLKVQNKNRAIFSFNPLAGRGLRRLSAQTVEACYRFNPLTGRGLRHNLSDPDSFISPFQSPCGARVATCFFTIAIGTAMCFNPLAGRGLRRYCPFKCALDCLFQSPYGARVATAYLSSPHFMRLTEGKSANRRFFVLPCFNLITHSHFCQQNMQNYLSYKSKNGRAKLSPTVKFF